jgi:signal transduction histidine kinase
MKEIDLKEVISEITENYKAKLGPQFTFTVPEREMRIFGEKARLLQVFDNILNNAIKHTPKDARKIELELKIKNSTVRIEVRDNGAGIESKNIEIIFEQYIAFGSDYSRSGTGLGLYICKKIIEGHKGTIEAQSEGKGKGTSIVITLPIIQK